MCTTVACKKLDSMLLFLFTYFWAHLCLCTVDSYASLKSVRLSGPKFRLENNSYLRKYGSWYVARLRVIGRCEPLLGGVHAPCSFYNLPSCSLLLSIFCPLLLFCFFPAPFSFFCFPCSFLIFPLAPCSFFKLSTAPCSFLPFLVLLAPGLHLSAPCSFTYSTACFLLLCVK